MTASFEEEGEKIREIKEHRDVFIPPEIRRSMQSQETRDGNMRSRHEDTGVGRAAPNGR